MGSPGPLPLLLLIGCCVLGTSGASNSRPQLSPAVGLWLTAGATLHLKCEGPGPQFLLMGPGLGLLETITSRRHRFVTFGSNNITNVTRAHSGPYTCRCQDPPDPPGPPSNPVEVVVTDPHLDAPTLWLGPMQPLPVPEGMNVSVVCKGPPQPGTFRLYRGGPGASVGEQWVAGGGNVTFTLSPLHPQDQNAYFCTYSPEGGGVSRPSAPLLLLVEGRGATPKSPSWPGCQYLGGAP